MVVLAGYMAEAGSSGTGWHRYAQPVADCQERWRSEWCPYPEVDQVTGNPQTHMGRGFADAKPRPIV